MGHVILRPGPSFLAGRFSCALRETVTALRRTPPEDKAGAGLDRDAAPFLFRDSPMRHALAIAGLVAGVGLGAANSHDWYSGTTNRDGQSCCSGFDCQMISGELVEEVRGGFRIRLQPGQHVMVTSPVDHFVPYRDLQNSPDGKWHICLFPTQNQVRCFFGPVGGS